MLHTQQTKGNFIQDSLFSFWAWNSACWILRLWWDTGTQNIKHFAKFRLGILYWCLPSVTVLKIKLRSWKQNVLTNVESVQAHEAHSSIACRMLYLPSYLSACFAMNAFRGAHFLCLSCMFQHSLNFSLMLSCFKHPHNLPNFQMT